MLEQDFKRVIIELSFCGFIQTNHSFDLFSDALDSSVPELPSQILVVRDVVPGGFEPRVLASLGLWARILVATIVLTSFAQNSPGRIRTTVVPVHSFHSLTSHSLIRIRWRYLRLAELLAAA